MRWIFGDVHGMLKPLRTLVDEIDRVDASAKLYFVGDYVNRGPESRATLDFLITLKNARFCRGNHDDIFDLILNGLQYAESSPRGDRVAALKWFLQHGLIQTFVSYGADFGMLERMQRDANEKQLKQLVELVPPEHRRFVRNLRAIVEEDDLFIAHAMWPLDQPDADPKISFRLNDAALRFKLLWGRYEYVALASEKSWKRTGYFGHTPVQNYSDQAGTSNLPLVGEKIVLLDTGAVMATDGRLTAFNADTRQYLQTDPGGKLVAR
jgi:serine/threonine protein phosphatase 1